MFKYFDNIPLDDEEQITEERVENIKASVLSRVKEEKAMSKRTTIKTITIAVAAATTAALSAMIASAEQPAWTPATDVEYTVDDAAEVSEVIVDNNIDEAKTDEKVNDWTVVNDGSDLATIYVFQRSDDLDAYYYYHKVPADRLEEMLSNGWSLIYEYDVPEDE